jgi:hypothetical protein
LLKRDMWPGEGKGNVDQKSADLTGLTYESDVMSSSHSTEFEISRVIDIPNEITVPEVNVPLYGDRASVLSGQGILLDVSECYSCGSEDSSFCGYCGRCSHCCQKTECQYGCDFV